MSTVEITRVEDVRAGDVVTLSYQGHEFTGVAWVDPDSGGLNVGPEGIKWYRQDGPVADIASFVRATREVSDLPVEYGSVITKATVRGVEGQTVILDPEGDWFTTECIDGHYYHDPEDITAWEPARIVSEED